MPDRSRNPVQMIQGYVQRGEDIILNTIPEQTIQVQKTYPGATVTVLSRLPNGVDTEFATIFNRDGTPAANPFTSHQQTGYYSFYAQSGRYDIQFSGNGVPTFKLDDVPVESLIYNVRDYGAKGDRVTDDTLAIRAAITAMINANVDAEGVGTLFFPNGRYLVSKQPDGLVFDLPSGIIVQGTAGPYSGIGTSNCQIVLTSSLASIFRIRNNRHKIIIRDIGLTTSAGDQTETIAIEARQDVSGGYTTGLEFDNLTIWGFERGISVEGSHIPNPQQPDTFFQWDISGIKINHCHIGECDYCIYLNSQTCDFCKITTCRIAPSIAGYGIYMERVGSITLDSILGAGSGSGASKSNTFIYLTPGHGAITISNSESEGFINSIQLLDSEYGNIGWPILVSNCAFGNPILLAFNCDYVSVGNRYAIGTVQCTGHGTHVMIYSFGDICAPFGNSPEPYPADIPKPGYEPFVLMDNSRVVTRSNRFRMDFGQPARFGGQAGQIAPLLAGTALAVSTFDDSQPLPQAQIALCNASGDVLFHVLADEGFIYFQNPRTLQGRPPVKLMKLDVEGNLTIKGKLEENTDP